MRTSPNSFCRTIGLSLLVAFLCGFALAQPKTDEKTVLTGFERNIAAGRFAEVEGPLFTFVVANPSNARGFYLLARLRYGQKRVPEARSLLSKSLSLDPAFVGSSLLLARIHLDAGETDLAKGIVNRVEDKDLADPTLRLMAAETAAAAGDCVKAVAFAEKLSAIVRNSDALSLRATCYIASADSNGLAALIATAKKSAARNQKAAFGLATVLASASMNRESADLLLLLVTAAPKNFEALMLLAKTEIALREYAKARTRIIQAEKIQPKSPDLLFVKSLLESEQGNNGAALDLLEQALAAKAGDAQILARFVIVAIRAGQPTKGLRAAEKLRAMEPENIDYLYLHGIAALQSNSLATAESTLRQFVAARPNDPLGCLAMGMTLAAQPAKLDAARRQMETCLEVNPNNYEAAYQLGLSYKVQGETSKATEYLERTIRLAPEYAAALRDLGSVYLQSGNEQKARPILEKAAAIAPNDAETHFQLSRLYNLIGERELAKKEMELFQKLRAPKKEGM